MELDKEISFSLYQSDPFFISPKSNLNSRIPVVNAKNSNSLPYLVCAAGRFRAGHIKNGDRHKLSIFWAGAANVG